jgi:Bacterial EndoU nuclease
MVEPTIRPRASAAQICAPEGADRSDLEFRAGVLEQQWADHISGTFALSPEQSLQLRDARERIARILHPNERSLSSGYSRAEQAVLTARQVEQLRQGNTVGMAFAGPILSVLPGTGRLLGAPEQAVAALESMNLDIALMPRIARPLGALRPPIAEPIAELTPRSTVAPQARSLRPSSAPQPPLPAGNPVRPDLTSLDRDAGWYLRVSPLSPSSRDVLFGAETRPPKVDIAFEHVLDGEVKLLKDGTLRATGGHYVRSPNVRVLEELAPPDVNGVTKARIAVRDPDTGRWVEKKGDKHTFVPRHWSERQTREEIEAAYRTSRQVESDPNKWEGTSPSGVPFMGYYPSPQSLLKSPPTTPTFFGSAATAWPVYQGR